MSVNIKAVNSGVRGMKLIVPIDGIIEIDANGISSVSEKAAEMLVNGTNDWEYADSKENEKDVKDNPEKSEDELIFEGIKSMKLDEMLNMAREANYPEEEWSRFAKKEKLMSAYLIKKYNEAKLIENEDKPNDGE